MLADTDFFLVGQKLVTNPDGFIALSTYNHYVGCMERGFYPLNSSLRKGPIRSGMLLDPVDSFNYYPVSAGKHFQYLTLFPGVLPRRD